MRLGNCQGARSQVYVPPPKRDNLAWPGPGSKQSSDKGIIETAFLAEVTQDNVAFFPRERIRLRCRKPFPLKVGEMVYQPKVRFFRPSVAHHSPESPVDDIPAGLQAKAAQLIETRPEYVQRRQVNVNKTVGLKVRQDIAAKLANVVMVQPRAHKGRFPALYPVPVVFADR